jgi:hypothetical protein
MKDFVPFKLLAPLEERTLATSATKLSPRHLHELLITGISLLNMYSVFVDGGEERNCTDKCRETLHEVAFPTV